MIRATLFTFSLALVLGLSQVASAQVSECATSYAVTGQGVGRTVDLTFSFEFGMLPTPGLQTGTVVVEGEGTQTVTRLVPQQQVRTIRVLGRTISIPITVLVPVTETIITLLPEAEGQWAAIDFCQGAVFVINDSAGGGTMQAIGFTSNGQLTGVAIYSNFGGLTGPFVLQGTPVISSM
jgi:hypothetical protein